MSNLTSTLRIFKSDKYVLYDTLTISLKKQKYITCVIIEKKKMQFLIL